MRILLIHPPHRSIGSRIPRENLPPLGLLAVGGPLLDAGHELRLLNADLAPMSVLELVLRARAACPDVIMLGHSGSTSAHPAVAELGPLLRAAMPDAVLVYGGVFPSYHWREILVEIPAIDVIVRGEGEETALALVTALRDRTPLSEIPGLAFRDEGIPIATPAAPPVRDLDAQRVGWELIDHRDYSYWGGVRAVVMQFSRGCPHRCNYCGQRDFWSHWRHRDPQAFAAEIARLYREEGVELVNLADENPTAQRWAWRAFLEALIAEDVPVRIVGSTRADDIVRDADILPLYKRAGVERFLLGMESTDEATLRLVNKGASVAADREAIRLLREHGILSMATWVVGFEEETDARMLRGLRQILAYDPDQIQTLYVTPHRWTPFYGIASERRVVDDDRSKWDYKHQVLATSMSPARLFAWVKAIEVAVQARPKAIARTLAHPDPKLRHAMRWYTAIGRRVWFHEVAEFLGRARRLRPGKTLSETWGAPQGAAMGVGSEGAVDEVA